MANYTYFSKATSQGLTMHVIQTTPQQVEILDLNRQNTLKSAKRFGINTGYWDMSLSPYNMLNIAMCDGQALEYRWHQNGWGFICWDGKKLSSEYVTQGSDVQSNLTAKGSWGQGGFRMMPGCSYQTWYDALINSTEAKKERIITETTTARSALVVNAVSNLVYLVATSGSKSFNFATFRDAVGEAIGFSNNSSSESTTYKGIILDGGGSTQLRCTEKKIETSRNLRQVMVLRDITG